MTFWPGQKCHSKVMHRKEVTHSNGSYERKSRGQKLADEMGRAKKFPWYTHRLMHRKRVTSELHDSYFRLMTIKHSISKIEWASNDYITHWVRQPVELKIGRSYRWDVVGKATSGRRRLWALMNWVPVPVEFDAQGASRVASRVPESWSEDVVGKATPDRGGPREPRWSLGSREDADKMQ